MPRHSPPHEEMALLPWYLSSTLPPDERASVAAHLETCPDCRRELQALERLKPAIEATVDARAAPSPDLFARVAARTAEKPRRSWWAALADLAGTLLAPRLAPALAIGMIVLQFGALAVLATRLYQVTPGEHVTQSAPPPGSVATGARLRVAFRETATEREIRSALESVGAQIVEGPSAAGFYVVALPPEASATRAVEALRGRDAVRFVEALRT